MSRLFDPKPTVLDDHPYRHPTALCDATAQQVAETHGTVAAWSWVATALMVPAVLLLWWAAGWLGWFNAEVGTNARRMDRMQEQLDQIERQQREILGRLPREH